MAPHSQLFFVHIFLYSHLEPQETLNQKISGHNLEHIVLRVCLGFQMLFDGRRGNRSRWILYAIRLPTNSQSRLGSAVLLMLSRGVRGSNIHYSLHVFESIPRQVFDPRGDEGVY